MCLSSLGKMGNSSDSCHQSLNICSAGGKKKKKRRRKKEKTLSMSTSLYIYPQSIYLSPIYLYFFKTALSLSKFINVCSHSKFIDVCSHSISKICSLSKSEHLKFSNFLSNQSLLSEVQILTLLIRCLLSALRGGDQ